MAKIIAPNKQYTGLSAGVSFVNGIGETDDKHLIEWFESKGYEVEVEVETTGKDELTVAEIKAKLDELGIEYNARDNKQTLTELLYNASDEE